MHHRFFYSKSQRKFMLFGYSPEKKWKGINMRTWISNDLIPIQKKYHHLFIFDGETLEVMSVNVATEREKRLFSELENKIIVEMI